MSGREANVIRRWYEEELSDEWEIPLLFSIFPASCFNPIRPRLLLAGGCRSGSTKHEQLVKLKIKLRFSFIFFYHILQQLHFQLSLSARDKEKLISSITNFIQVDRETKWLWVASWVSRELRAVRFYWNEKLFCGKPSSRKSFASTSE